MEQQQQYKVYNCQMEGYLDLWQGYFSRWQKYYFRIHDQLLLLGPSKEEVEGKVHLRVAQVISKLDDPLSLLLHTGTETLYLRAYSIDQKVKWFKRLKEAQRQNQQQSQNKEFFKMKLELSRLNRFKILDDLNTELWRCHAELQQRLQEVIAKTKNVMVGKNIDRLRISIDEFKYKTAQMLQYIDEEIRDSRDRETTKSVSKSKSRKTERHQQEGSFDANPANNHTHFYSFTEEQKTGKSKNRLSLQSLEQLPEEEHSFSSLQFRLRQRKSVQQSPRPTKKRGEGSSSASEVSHRNSIKYTLFHENKVYLKIGRIFSSNETRKCLPEKFKPEQRFPVIGTVSSALTGGADLSKATMPVTTNEPISWLQKSCEQMYYCELLRKADEQDDQSKRMLYVTAFVVSTYSMNDKRIKRPLNPLLGETFEFIDDSKGFEFLAEQVSHNPAISACCVRSDNYELYDSFESTVSFSGNSIKMVPLGKTVLKLERHSDYYVFNKCVVALSNIIFGKTAVQVYGQVRIHCKDYNTEAVLQFQEESLWKSSQAGRVIGHLNNQGKKVYSLEGHWKNQLTATNIETKQKIVVWQKSHVPDEDYYYFNQMTFQLNHLSARNSKQLAPTDSRLRADQRALEYRLMDLASEEKSRLQEKQRNRVASMQKTGEEHRVLWFNKSVMQGEQVYVSNERYWDQKIKGTWRDCPDIFN